MIENNLYFLHYRKHDENDTPLSHGGVTLAIRAYPSRNIAYVGIARCSERDVFSRKKGRNIATQRIYSYEAGNLVDNLGERIFQVALESGVDIKTSVDHAYKKSANYHNVW